MRASTMAALIALAVPAFATPPFYVQDIREVCSLPRPNNNGLVLGHDNGSSILYNGMSYWFFADTVWDQNGTGAQENVSFGNPDDDTMIGIGTVAVTTDLDASDGLDMTYRTDASGKLTSLFPPSALQSGECLIWPVGAVVANNTIYLYATAVIGCYPLAYQNILASVDPVTMQATRLVTIQDVFAPSHFNVPYRVTDPDGVRIYIAGRVALPPPYYSSGFLLARVLETNITNPALYEYWNGSTWVVNSPQSAAVIFWGGIDDTVRISYNDFLGRYLVVYSCNVGLKLCARTANTPGPGSSALVGGWSEEVVLYECPGEGYLDCYAGYLHPEYGTGSTLYLTTARINPGGIPCTSNSDCYCPGYPASSCVNNACTMPAGLTPRYTLRLRAVTIGTTPPPAGRIFADAGRDYSPRDRCDFHYNPQNAWSFQRLASGRFSLLNFDYQWNWIGNTDVQGTPAPWMDEDTAFPALAQQAVRVWAAPGAGTVRITGEVRKRRICGNTAWAEIIRIQNDQVVGGPPIWSAQLSPTARSVIYDLTTTVQAGDSLGFAVRRGGQTAVCDELLFAPLLTYTP